MASPNPDRRAIQHLESEFPYLRVSGYELTSPHDQRYNCIAWAYGDSRKRYWPAVGISSSQYFWPNGITRAATVKAFEDLFRLQGYDVCTNRDLEHGLEKVAIYANLNGAVQHAARQLSDGRWTSKMGDSYDLSHTLEGIEGGCYGYVARIMSRNVVTTG